MTEVSYAALVREIRRNAAAVRHVPTVSEAREAAYCCRCGQKLSAERYAIACRDCAWRWEDPCPAREGQNRLKAQMRRGVMCGECGEEAEAVPFSSGGENDD